MKYLKRFEDTIEKFDLVLYYNRKIQDKIVKSHVFIPEDENFIDKVKEVEKSKDFISWNKNTKELISDVLNKLN